MLLLIYISQLSYLHIFIKLTTKLPLNLTGNFVIKKTTILWILKYLHMKNHQDKSLNTRSSKSSIRKKTHNFSSPFNCFLVKNVIYL